MNKCWNTVFALFDSWSMLDFSPELYICLLTDRVQSSTSSDVASQFALSRKTFGSRCTETPAEGSSCESWQRLFIERLLLYMARMCVAVSNCCQDILKYSQDSKIYAKFRLKLKVEVCFLLATFLFCSCVSRGCFRSVFWFCFSFVSVHIHCK